MMVPVIATIGAQIIFVFVGSLTKPFDIVDVDEVVPGAGVMEADGAGVVVVAVGDLENVVVEVIEVVVVVVGGIVVVVVVGIVVVVVVVGGIVVVVVVGIVVVVVG